MQLRQGDRRGDFEFVLNLNDACHASGEGVQKLSLMEGADRAFERDHSEMSFNLKPGAGSELFLLDEQRYTALQILVGRANRTSDERDHVYVPSDLVMVCVSNELMGNNNSDSERSLHDS